MTLSNGEELFVEHYISTLEGHVLVCADVYDEKYRHAFDGRMVIAISICYSVSLLCLLTTFLIHVRYRPLRTLPGLMLMNLIAALFSAQLMYLMNSLGLFHGNPILCQVLATAQHYFWLTSFTWMACMSLDIFKCLSTSCTRINTYNAAKYHKCVFAAWLAPLPIPVVANVLTKSATSDVGYDSTLCWLAGARSVLYLFALPVLSIVAGNIILFVGSMCRLCVLLQNAAFVGRKEENKKRLAQCIKLSSWMGISWLFGIIPNYVDIDILWYVFAILNALQGVHIFFAFGVTGRARVLVRRGMSEKPTVSTALSPAVHSISAGLEMEWTCSFRLLHVGFWTEWLKCLKCHHTQYGSYGFDAKTVCSGLIENRIRPVSAMNPEYKNLRDLDARKKRTFEYEPCICYVVEAVLDENGLKIDIFTRKGHIFFSEWLSPISNGRKSARTLKCIR